MKIYTREKKPTLYGLLAISLAAAAVVGLMLVFMPGWGIYGVSNIAVFTAFYFAVALVMLIIALKRQIEYNPYSYNTIYYFGFSLFVLAVLITHIVAAYEATTQAQSYGLPEIARLVLDSAKNYMRLSMPFLAVFSAGLMASNIVLIRREGKRFVNLLGIILALALIAGEAVLIYFGNAASGVWEIVLDIFCAVFLYYECMLIGTIFADVLAAIHIPEYDKDYIIILGCRVMRNREPTPLLRNRIDRALEFYREQQKATGKKASFIASGGKGPDEPVSEAECMKNYLVAKGIPPRQIIEEDKSTDTMENMRFSFDKVGEQGKFAFSTTNYHVFRSGIASNRACKKKAEGMGADTKWYFWPNASVREFVGLLTQHRGKQILIMLGLLTIYISLALLVR